MSDWLSHIQLDVQRKDLFHADASIHLLTLVTRMSYLPLFLCCESALYLSFYKPIVLIMPCFRGPLSTFTSCVHVCRPLRKSCSFQTHIPTAVALFPYTHIIMYSMHHLPTESNQSVRVSSPFRGNLPFQTHTPICLFDLIFSPLFMLPLTFLHTLTPSCHHSSRSHYSFHVVKEINKSLLYPS